MTVVDVNQISTSFQALILGTESGINHSQALGILATASKDTQIVRDRLSQRSVLEALVQTIDCALNDDFETTSLSLRCIGNACIDNTGRQNITDIGFAWASNCLGKGDEALRLLTARALYNICFNFEPAQRRCYEERLHYGLVGLLWKAKLLGAEDITLLVDLLFEITSQKDVTDQCSGKEQSFLPDDVLLQFLRLPRFLDTSASLEDVATAVETVLVYLRDAEVQRQIVTSHLLGDSWDIMQLIETRLIAVSRNQPSIELERGDGADDDVDDDENEDDTKILTALSTSITWCLSDIAATPQFGERYKLDDKTISLLIKRIASRKGSTRLMTAAYQIVGNLLRHLPIRDVAMLVKDSRISEDGPGIQSSVFEAVIDNDDIEMLHSAAGFIIQLTRPSTNVRLVIGEDANALAALTKLCAHGTPQVKQDGITLLRALGRDCPANQERFAELARRAVMSTGSTTEAAMATSPSLALLAGEGMLIDEEPR
ncbi:hypothetical protein M433DRAFT_145776 [Acidomyces richmondensis BFW]|nr:hypothetical protein M433DRAFT_145776 [Acidomyces richmondensis BFW]